MESNYSLAKGQLSGYTYLNGKIKVLVKKSFVKYVDFFAKFINKLIPIYKIKYWHKYFEDRFKNCTISSNYYTTY